MKYNIFQVKIYFCLTLFTLSVNAIEKYDTHHLLDKTFGNNGIVTTNFGMNSGTFNKVVPSIHVKIQPDGKIIAVGHIEDSTIINLQDSDLTDSADCAIIRYEQSGELDPSFGQDKNGMVVTSASKRYNFLWIALFNPMKR